MVDLANSRHSLACNLRATESGRFDQCTCGLTAARESRRTGTAAPAPPKLDIVMTLREYEQLANEFIEEYFPVDKRELERWRLSAFILWLRKRGLEQRQQLTITKGEDDGKY